MTTPDTPAATEGLRERLVECLKLHEDEWVAKIIADALWPIIEAELQKRDEAKARLVGEFSRLAAFNIGDATESHRRDDPRMAGIYNCRADVWNLAAQMLEDSKP